jgi:hypothetical protein
MNPAFLPLRTAHFAARRFLLANEDPWWDWWKGKIE